MDVLRAVGGTSKSGFCWPVPGCGHGRFRDLFTAPEVRVFMICLRRSIERHVDHRKEVRCESSAIKFAG